MPSTAHIQCGLIVHAPKTKKYRHTTGPRILHIFDLPVQAKIMLVDEEGHKSLTSYAHVEERWDTLVSWHTYSEFRVGGPSAPQLARGLRLRWPRANVVTH